MRLGKLFVLSMIVVIIGQSCRDNSDASNEENNILKIRIPSTPSALPLEKLVEKLKVIQLQSNDSSIISDAWSIGNILFEEGKYFVLDGRYMAIKVFDSTGKYLYSVGRLGLGKGQFDIVEDIGYCKDHQSLVILCNKPDKISEYQLDGKFVRDNILNFWASSIAFLPNNVRCFYVNQNESDVSGRNNLLLTDSNYKVKARMVDFPKNLATSVMFSGGLFNIGDEAYFNPAFSPVYYKVDGEKVVPLFKVDYGERNLPSSKNEVELMNNVHRSSYQYQRFVKTGDMVGFNYRDTGPSTAFASITDSVVVTSNPKGDSLNLLFSLFVFQSEKRIIQILDTKRIMPFLKRNSRLIEARFPGFMKTIDTANPHPNPVLLDYELRGF